MAGQNERDRVNFDDRTDFYLNNKSRGFLHEMAVKEKLLLQMIQNITAEMDARGADIPNYDQIVTRADRLIAEYSSELIQVVRLIDEMSYFEQIAAEYGAAETAHSFLELQNATIDIFEDKELYKQSLGFTGRASLLIKEYHAEINEALALYRRLEKLERRANEQGNLDLLDGIAAQKKAVRHMLGDFDSPELDALASHYCAEMDSTVRVLKELDQLHSQAVVFNKKVSLDIQELRRAILRGLDRRLLALMGYDNLISDGSRIEELFKEWKAAYYVEISTGLARYQIARKSLLENASLAETGRMLQRDLHDAYSNYAHSEHALAAMQFDLLLQDYGARFSGVENVIFCRAESYYARKFFDEAKQDYLNLVANYRNSETYGESLFRLMQLADREDSGTEFSQYFSLVQFQAGVSRKCLDKCHYLAGTVFLRDLKFDAAKETFARISEGSEYHANARFLTGVALANQNSSTDALTIFSELADSLDAHPWIKNQANLRLGYIYYDREEFEQALAHFNQISADFENKDQGLLGAGWANLKLQNYAQTSEKVEVLFNNHPASDHTYEALVLSAHAKKLMHRHDAALYDLRYVGNARSVVEMSGIYNTERKLILDQLATLDQLEEMAIAQQDRSAHELISAYRDDFQNRLRSLGHPGAKGNFTLQNVNYERKAILGQLDELDRVLAQATEQNENEVVEDALLQKERLLKTLKTYDPDKAIASRLHYIDYPLATKEGVENYRKQISDQVWQSVQNEQVRLQKGLANIAKLQNGTEQTVFDLEILAEDFNRLRQDAGRLQAWLAENQADELHSHVNTVADFSGFGMTDLTYASMAEKDERIAELSGNTDFIITMLGDRKKILEKQIMGFETEIKQLEREYREQQIELEKQEREKYFNDSYFDTTDSEVQRGESTGQIQNSNTPAPAKQ